MFCGSAGKRARQGKVAIDLLEKLLRDFCRVEIVASGDNVLTISNEGGNCG